MKNDFETFLLAYQAAPQPIKDIIDSETIGIFVDGLLAEHSLPQTHKRAFLVIVSNRLLAISSDSDVIAALHALTIGSPLTEKIGSLIKAFVQNKIDGVVTAAVTKEESAVPLQNIPPIVNPRVSTTTLSGVRTMVGDMAKAQAGNEVIYSSSQEALLREAMTVPKAPAPKPTEGSWG